MKRYMGYLILALLIASILVLDGCQYRCWDGCLVQDIKECPAEPTLSKEDMGISVYWLSERSTCTNYDKNTGKVYDDIRYDKDLKEKPYNYFCVFKVDNSLQRYSGGEPVERRNFGQGPFKGGYIQGANVFEDHTVELCCFLGKSAVSGGKPLISSQGNTMYSPITDEVCVEDTLAELC